MKNKIGRFFILISLILLASVLNSCKKFLDIKPDSKLVVPNTLQDLRALLDQPNYNNLESPSWDEASTDDYYVTTETFNSLIERIQKAYKWEDFDYIDYPNDWSKIYNSIYPANVVLDEIIKIQRTSQNNIEWDDLRGTALFLRSQSLLRGLFTFSPAYDEQTADKDYGMVLRLNSDFNETSIRTTVKKTYDQLLQDLKEAASLLPVTPKHVLRPSRPAAYALLSRVYLSMRSYDSAFKYADLSLQLKNDLLDYNTDVDPNNLLFPVPQFNKETIFSSIISAYTYNSVAPGNALVDSSLYATYADDDLRKQVFFLDGSLLGSEGYVFQGTYDGQFTSLFIGIATDEMWLTRAECFTRLGDVDKAMRDLNTLLEKRWRSGTYLNLSASNQDEALNLILQERRKELLFRGVRWMDIKRLNKEGANITLRRRVNGVDYTLPPNDPRYALLLPSDIVSQENIPQNPR